MKSFLGRSPANTQLPEEYPRDLPQPEASPLAGKAVKLLSVREEAVLVSSSKRSEQLAGEVESLPTREACPDGEGNDGEMSGRNRPRSRDDEDALSRAGIIFFRDSELFTGLLARFSIGNSH